MLANWWAEVVKGTSVRLYAGVALYKVGTPAAGEPAWAVEGGVPELKRQLDPTKACREWGTILFRQRYLTEPQTDKAVEYLRTRWKTGQ